MTDYLTYHFYIFPPPLPLHSPSLQFSLSSSFSQLSEHSCLYLFTLLCTKYSLSFRSIGLCCYSSIYFQFLSCLRASLLTFPPSFHQFRQLSNLGLLPQIFDSDFFSDKYFYFEIILYALHILLVGQLYQDDCTAIHTLLGTFAVLLGKFRIQPINSI